VIILDSDWNPQQDLQAECRAHRIGQTKPVRVLTLASKGTIDEWILKRAQEKRAIDNKVIQAGMFNNDSSAEDRQQLLEELFSQEGFQVH
jgi:SWI/SNF-related matrix-associated actin-dependent regulator of chromatin subfamily A protein 2/4